MKKLFLALFVLFSIHSAIFATTYKSNILMQKLSDSSDADYYLIVQDDKESLFDIDNNLIKDRTTKTTQNFDNVSVIVETNDYINSSVQNDTYIDDLLVSSEYVVNGVSSITHYNYDDNDSLIFSSRQIGTEKPIVTFYIRDSVSGQLIGTKSSDSYNWNGSNYLIDNDLMLTEISSNVFLEDSFTYNEDDTITYEKNGITFIYSLSGLLLEEKGDNYLVKYIYNENGECISSESISDNERIESIYENNLIVKSTTYKNDLIVESTQYLVSGMKKILYSNEKPVAEICYDKSNIKIIDIRYLN